MYHSQPLQADTYEWWKVDFGETKTVTSILYANREDLIKSIPERNYHKFTVGNNSLPQLNTVCAYTTIYSGWYSCSIPLQGSVFGVCQTLHYPLHFLEVYVYSEYYVQQNKMTAVLSSTLPGSSPEFALSVGPQYLQMSQANLRTASSTNIEPGQTTYTITMNAVTQIEKAVILALSGYGNGMQITLKQGKTTVYTSPQINNNHGKEYEINFMADTFIVSSTKQLSVASLGILSRCDCRQTSFSPDLIKINKKNPSQISVEVDYNKGNSATVIIYMYDTISLVCGDANGVNFCGQRQLRITDIATNREETTLIKQQNSGSNIVLTIQSTQRSQIGSYTFELKVNLEKYSLSNTANELATTLFVTVTGNDTPLQWHFSPDAIYYLVARQEKFLSFSWKDDHSDSFIVEINLGEAQNFTDCTTYQSNGTGSIFCKFYPNSSMINTSQEISIKIKETENFSTTSQTPQTLIGKFSIKIISDTISTEFQSKKSSLENVKNNSSNNRPSSTINYTIKQSDQVKINHISINSSGLITIKFLVPMKLTINPQFKASNQSLVVDIIRFYIQIYHNQEDIYTGGIKVMPSPNFTVIQFNGRNLLLQLNFSNPNQLSKSIFQTKDKITLVFNDTQVLISAQDELAQEKRWNETEILPVQINASTQPSDLEKKLVQNAVIVTQSVMTSNLALNLLMSQSLSKLWSCQNILQLMVNIPLVSTINLPLNLANVIQGFVDVAAFNIFPSETVTDSIIGRENFSDEILDPYNERFELNSYTTSNFIYNMGTSFYFLIFLLAATVILYILTKFVNSCAKNRVVIQSIHRLWEILTPSLFIRTFLQINSNTLICCVIQLVAIKRTKTWADYISTIFCVITAILQIIFPFVFATIIHKLKQAKILHLIETKRKYGELYYDFYRFNTTLIVQLFFQVFWLERQLLTTILYFTFTTLPSIQIGILLSISLFWCAYLISCKPYYQPLNNMINLMNETLYYFSLVFCISFTVINTDLEASKIIGYIVIGFIITMVGANITIISFTTSKYTYKTIKISFIKRKIAKKTNGIVERQKQNQKFQAILQAEQLKLQKQLQFLQLKQKPLDVIAEELESDYSSIRQRNSKKAQQKIDDQSESESSSKKNQQVKKILKKPVNYQKLAEEIRIIKESTDQISAELKADLDKIKNEIKRKTKQVNQSRPAKYYSQSDQQAKRFFQLQQPEPIRLNQPSNYMLQSTRVNYKLGLNQ